jgi:hypothetical protein
MTARREQRKRFPIRHTSVPAAEMTKTGAESNEKERQEPDRWGSV